ncbi:transposase [Microcoleus sp. Pol7_A1]|uniref:transposase n=1 Tax=Microcoleus sp. Pol7_A1 TaxID=2818893 RepID=UPI0040407C6B
MLYQLKNGCNWSDLPRDLPPYSTVFWHYQNWCEDGALDQILTTLHSKVRGTCSKKTTVDDIDNS